MDTMRQLVSDARLYRALDIVEARLGYEIKAIPMPERHRHRAICGIGLNKITEELALVAFSMYFPFYYCQKPFPW